MKPIYDDDSDDIDVDDENDDADYYDILMVI